MFVHTSATSIRRSAAQSVSHLALRWLLAVAVTGLGCSAAAAAAAHQAEKPAHRAKDAVASHAKKDVVAKPKDASAAKHKDTVVAKPKDAPAAKKDAVAKHRSAQHTKAVAKGAKHDRAAGAVPMPQPRPSLADLPPDQAAVKEALGLVRSGKLHDATTLEASIADPVARTLIEWMLLRSGDSEAGFDRYAAFIRTNPDWPGIGSLRRRAETRLWQERRDVATVRGFIGSQPTGVMGEFALARALIAAGDRDAAEAHVRAAWRAGDLSAETESAVIEAFPDLLTRADHAARMDRRLGAKDFAGAARAAKRLGDADVALVKACHAAEDNASNARAQLDKTPDALHDDPGYALCRIHALLHGGEVAAAAKVALAAANASPDRLDTDEWWRERRILARKLIDQGDAKTAYLVVRDAATPANPYYRAERHFMAGWIALRFLADPTKAGGHFAHIDDGSADPIVLARAAYWRGRAAEAAGDLTAMRAHYEEAARHPTAYYGQLARARLGLGEIELRPAPREPLTGVAKDLVHAAEILYAIGERDLVLTFTTDLADRGQNPATIAALAALATRHDDAHVTLMIGKTALSRGLALDLYAFPEIGLPRYAAVGPPVERSVMYSVARTESAFDQRDRSPAKAVGLLQVTPEAGRDTSKRIGLAYNWDRLVADPVYNTQMGAGELAALIREYRGSFIMTFAGYNAGRGRVKEWVAAHGDPRDPKVDAVDWVERIPIAETRNYVQRVMENLAVYRARFGEGATVAIEPNLQRAATIESRAE
ncbi:MAG TPA: lytic transglycosylase domain-containing protein [Xanthobacteraceae bacterium]|nr:lytic transglycosylase domain-containing protein [Xanthobacteraceae bacterium]